MERTLPVGKFWFITHFLITASSLYCIHLLVATYRQLKRTAEHDQYAGTSHLARLLPTSALNPGQTEIFELIIHLWIEPTLVLVSALVLRVLGEYYLSSWLFFVAGCFWLKKLLNYWLGIRRESVPAICGRTCKK